MTDRYIRIARKHRTKVGFAGFVVALAIAGAYLFVLPTEAANDDGVRQVILTYGHSMVWVLLSVASLVWGYGRSAKGVKLCLYAAAVVYGVFVVTLVTS